MAESSRIEELRRRVQMDPASIAFAALAEEYRRAGRCEEAVAVCRAGLQRHPAYLSARVTLGRALLEIGQHEEARTELEHVLRLAPENLAAIRGLADIHARHGRRPDEAETDSEPPTEPAEASGQSAPAPAAAPAAPGQPPAAAAPVEPAPATVPVQSRPAAGPVQPPAPAGPAQPPATARPVQPSAAAVIPIPVSTVPPDPDFGAIPALELFLDGIQRARDAAAPERAVAFRVSSDR
jgi:tetratricopeptide (TPR) repeat protein